MTDLERLGDEARRALGRFESAPGLAELVQAWPGVVGDEIARNAWPARVSRDGTLHVATSSSTWAFELTQLEEDIRTRLGAKVTKDVPKKLRFAPGPLPAPAPEPADETSRERLVASAKARSHAAALTSAIDDDELREAVARAAAASLQRASADRSVW